MEHPAQLVVSDSIVHEFPDIHANTMAVDSTGRYAIICSRKCMIIVELDSPQQNYKRLPRDSKYEPSSSQFNRLIKDLFAITTSQVVDVFSIEDEFPSKPKLSLRGHSRGITDIDWSHFDPYLLGTSSADCTTNLWDVRENRRPMASLTSVSGATQVKFSKTSSNLVATSHEIDVRIWDTRQPGLPLHYIAAHLQKINGLDWNPHIGDQLVTCSQDCSIRLWDLSANKIKPGLSALSKSPAWRIRYTPFSSVGVVTSILPQLRSRNECNSLNLWSMRSYRYEKRFELLSTLVGHTDVVIDFDWRIKSVEPDIDCELVSWSKDNTLRIWKLDYQLTDLQTDMSDSETEGEPDTCVEDDMINVAQSQNYDTVDPTTNLKPILELSSASLRDFDKDDDSQIGSNDKSLSLVSPQELRQEFNLINKNIPNIEFEELNPLRRVCMVTARANNVTCRLRIALPPSYPLNESPTFTIIDGVHYGSECLSADAKDKLLVILNETAQLQLGRSRNCLEPCLRKFITTLQKLTNHNSRMRRKGSAAESSSKDDPITLSMQRDHSVPFPRTSGARFSGDFLVCFGRPILQSHGATASNEIAPPTNWLVETPRSMAQLSAYLDNRRKQTNFNYMLSNISISHFYYGSPRRIETTLKNRSSSHRNSRNLRTSRSVVQQSSIIAKSLKSGPVLICDVSAIQMGAISRYLADNYIFDRDVIKMCRKNAEVARTCGRPDLVQIWSLAELSAEGVLHSSLPGNHISIDGKTSTNDSSWFTDKPWTLHPFGGKLIQSLISHYVNNCHDVQTAAMLIWTFSSPKLERLQRNMSIRSPTAVKSISGLNSNVSNMFFFFS